MYIARDNKICYWGPAKQRIRKRVIHLLNKALNTIKLRLTGTSTHAHANNTVRRLH